MGEENEGRDKTSTVDDPSRKNVRIEPLPGTTGYRELAKGTKGKSEEK